MDWQNAVILSRQGVAARLTDDAKIVRREADGTAVVVAGGTIRVADSIECEGFQDWQPLDVIEATGIPEKMRGRGAIAMVAALRTKFAGDPAEDEIEWRRNYDAMLESLVEFACVYFMNICNEKISIEIRREVAVQHAAAWIKIFDSYL